MESAVALLPFQLRVLGAWMALNMFSWSQNNSSPSSVPALPCACPGINGRCCGISYLAEKLTWSCEVMHVRGFGSTKNEQTKSL